ncbi:HemK2/MTQ2 family protein methyltransferase [Sulfuracidifex tepidarius]|uniref:S-adenosylmethionine-dependent methyltransferase n=1 Tax=Sulfuracidifex tepidarius TaxID=1294262 RepID=A0A510DWS6_9CREN|nr:HemK2/MTQ2 family protein methyltransferase [Sulfuracidifex tepidarius]BBG24428.1 putative S-adenosylmethionine-dependent methyltransferase [Sulfuracidifex tepidarius]BBG27186.1 putative S-adenosylmethionine-dependent methyltransferase [Sulfuracidifex tepidarius]
MAGRRIIEFNKIRLCLDDQVYEPAEDTELILSLIQVEKGEKVIEIGSGTGILSIFAAKSGGKVIAVDVNPFAAESTLCSAGLNNVDIDVINGDMFSPLREGKFDVAIFNPPYLPFEEYDTWIQFSWSGGKSGAEPLLRFLEIDASRLYIIFSSLSDEDLIMSKIKERGLRVKSKREKQIGLETLYGLELVKC